MVSKHFEGALWGEKINGEWTYWTEFPDFQHGKRFIIDKVSSLDDARAMATENERTINQQMMCSHSSEIHKLGLEAFGWGRDCSDGDFGQFLMHKLNINTKTLSGRQRTQFVRDCIDLENPQTAKLERTELKKNIDTLVRAYNALEKAQSELLKVKAELPRNTPSVANTPLESLILSKEGILGELRAHKYLEESLNSRERRTSKALCLAAIRIYLRWKNDNRTSEERGVTFPANWEELFALDFKNGTPHNQLCGFVFDLVNKFKKKYPLWNFSAENEVRKCLLDRRRDFVAGYEIKPT